jgi:hypothetical protein
VDWAETTNGQHACQPAARRLRGLWIGRRRRGGDTRVGQLRDGLGAGGLSEDGEGVAHASASYEGERRPATSRAPKPGGRPDDSSRWLHRGSATAYGWRRVHEMVMHCSDRRAGLMRVCVAAGCQLAREVARIPLHTVLEICQVLFLGKTVLPLMQHLVADTEHVAVDQCGGRFCTVFVILCYFGINFAFESPSKSLPHV